MADINKLVKAWVTFRDSNPYGLCSGREFRAIREPEYCMGQMIEDTIALLKEQEAAKPREERHEVKVSYDWGDEVEVWSKFYCPHCGAMIANSNSQHFPRCMWCGRKVKWK